MDSWKEKRLEIAAQLLASSGLFEEQDLTSSWVFGGAITHRCEVAIIAANTLMLMNQQQGRRTQIMEWGVYGAAMPDAMHDDPKLRRVEEESAASSDDQDSDDRGESCGI